MNSIKLLLLIEQFEKSRWRRSRMGVLGLARCQSGSTGKKECGDADWDGNLGKSHREQPDHVTRAQIGGKDKRLEQSRDRRQATREPLDRQGARQ